METYKCSNCKNHHHDGHFYVCLLSDIIDKYDDGKPRRPMIYLADTCGEHEMEKL